MMYMHAFTDTVDQNNEINSLGPFKSGEYIPLKIEVG